MNRLLHLSKGMEQAPEWGGDQIDDDYEGGLVAVAPGPRPGRLKQAVHGLEAGALL